jgi:hypothetical protein
MPSRKAPTDSFGCGLRHEERHSSARGYPRVSEGRSTPGRRRGTEALAAVPSLDALAAEPDTAAALPYTALLAARRTAQRLVADLDHALALATPQAVPTPAQDGQADRLLTPAETIVYLAVSKRWFRRHGRALPGRVQLGPKTFAYQRSALERFVKQRAQP